MAIFLEGGVNGKLCSRACVGPGPFPGLDGPFFNLFPISLFSLISFFYRNSFSFVCFSYAFIDYL